KRDIGEPFNCGPSMNLEEYRRRNKEREASQRNKVHSFRVSWLWSTPSDRIALLGAISTAALALVAVWQLWVLRGQLTAMENDQRPWVYITTPVTMITPFHFDETGGHVSLQFTLKNVGKTPARFAKLDGNLFARGPMFY